MNNYPPGAAHDPLAPYNREDPPELEITVKETLTKDFTVNAWPEEDIAEVKNYWCNTAASTLEKCSKVLSALEKIGIRFIEHIDISALLDDCVGWSYEEEEITT